jgi:hypothetical protein
LKADVDVCWTRSELTADARIRTRAMLHLATPQCDLANISPNDITRHEATSPLRMSDNEEPDVGSDAIFIELDDDFAIAELIDV